MRIEDGLYTAAASGRMLDHDMDAVTENLANVATPGFKRLRPAAQASPFAHVLADATTAVPLPADPMTGRDWTHGPLDSTGSPFDVALGSDAFLQIKTPDGTRYTRDGRMQLDKDGTLVRLTGEPVLDTRGSEIHVPAGKPTIKADGTLLVDGSEVAQIGAVDIADRSQLTSEGEGRYRLASPDSSASSGAQPSAAPQFLQGQIEGSNVSAPRALVDMIEVSRSYESVIHAIKTLDGMLGRATASHGG